MSLRPGGRRAGAGLHLRRMVLHDSSRRSSKRNHPGLGGPQRAPLPLRAGRQPALFRSGAQPDGLSRGWRAGRRGSLPPPRAPGVRFEGRPPCLRQLQRPHPENQPQDRGDHHRPGQRPTGLQRGRGTGRGSRHADARRHLPGCPRQPLRGGEVWVPGAESGGCHGRCPHPGGHRRPRLRTGGAARFGDRVQLLRSGHFRRSRRHRALGRLFRAIEALRRADRNRDDRPGRHRRA